MNELKLVDKKLGCTIPDNEKNRRVIKKMKNMSLKDLHIWVDIYKKLIACDDCYNECHNEKLSRKMGYSPVITLKFYEHEIKLREKTGV